MTSEPSLNCRHLSIWQERHDASSLQVAYACSIAVVASEGPVVDANHVQRFGAQARPGPSPPGPGLSGRSMSVRAPLATLSSQPSEFFSAYDRRLHEPFVTVGALTRC